MPLTISLPSFVRLDADLSGEVLVPEWGCGSEKMPVEETERARVGGNKLDYCNVKGTFCERKTAL